MSMASMLSREDVAHQTYHRNEPPMSSALLQAANQAARQQYPESPPAENEADSDHHEKRVKRSRACQACRGMKIRCLPVEGQDACKACSKVNRVCVMPGPARKRQKTVHKVAELEQKINALTASLAAKENGLTPPTTDSPQTVSTPSGGQSGTLYPPLENRRPIYTEDPPVSVTESCVENITSVEKAYETADARMLGASPVIVTSDAYVDVITRNHVSQEIAHRIFQRWRKEMCVYCPVVAFPATTTIDWLRANRPMTLLAILGVACGTIRPELQSEFMVELSKEIAKRVSFLHEKSLDLIQALMVQPVWYSKHKYAKDLNFNHTIHSAVSMCLDLGLGKRSRSRLPGNSMEDIEKRRTWMGCYYLSCSVSTSLRLPQLVKFSPYLEECVECLSTNPSALPEDKFMCALVKMSHIFEDVGVLFQMDDPASSIQLKDPRTRYHFKMFERQLEDWKKSTRGLIPDALLDQYEAVASLYIHEITLHNEHNVDDFRPIAHEQIYHRTTHVGVVKDFFTDVHLESLAVCVDSMEKAMLAFHRFEQTLLRGLPTIHMVWLAYVAVAMVRLQGILQAPDSKYGSIFLPQLRIEYHLDNIISRLVSIVAEKAHSPVETFLLAFRKLRAWQVIRNGEGMPGRDEHSDTTSSEPHPRAQQDEQNPTISRSAGAYLSEETHNPHRYSISSNPPPSTLPHHSTTQPGTTNTNPRSNSTGQIPQSNTYPNHNHQQQQQQQRQQQPHPQNHLLDPTAPLDVSSFDIGNWDFNLNELNNFDTYMSDVGWMGYLV